MKRVVLLCALAGLFGCQTSPESLVQTKRLIKSIEQSPHRVDKIIVQAKTTQTAVKRDVDTLTRYLSLLEQTVRDIWGKENVAIPSRKKYVKYSNDYRARAIVDFASGRVTVETIADKQPIAMLRSAITQTLLTSNDPTKTDIFSSSAPDVHGEPFLHNLVLDQDNKPIRYLWRANRYAQYLIDNALEKSRQGAHRHHKVSFAMVNKYAHLQQQKYSSLVLAAARRYDLSPALIYGIIETESSFNPFAVSRANAYGLMQVVPSTAGRDVYEKVKMKPGQPTRQQLFQPAHNIDVGSAYLHLLDNRYLQKVRSNKSRHYAVISAYNGGAGNVLKTFSGNRKNAFELINRQAPDKVYRNLVERHPRQESRRYLQKVIRAEKGYL